MRIRVVKKTIQKSTSFLIQMDVDFAYAAFTPVRSVTSAAMGHLQLIVELYWHFKFRYEVLRVHTFWYDLFRMDSICQFLVTRSVTKESPVLIRSRTFEYDDPDRVQDYHGRGSRFGTI